MAFTRQLDVHARIDHGRAGAAGAGGWLADVASSMRRRVRATISLQPPSPPPSPGSSMTKVNEGATRSSVDYAVRPYLSSEETVGTSG